METLRPFCFCGPINVKQSLMRNIHVAYPAGSCAAQNGYPAVLSLVHWTKGPCFLSHAELRSETQLRRWYCEYRGSDGSRVCELCEA